jgi:MoaA/NifB/PqqE/SkfB family radical SAM enzyme
MQERSVLFNLEPTFRCNLACDMCPRFSSEDPHLDMSPETYERICLFMRYARVVDLTGWGEPLLHPRIYEMIAAAKEHGCEATMTSNGTALSERNAARLLDSGLDRLAVSVDGVRPETYNSIRAGSDFERVSQNLRRISELARRSGATLELAVAFTIQEANADELDLILPWMTSVGAQVLHLKQLNAVSNEADWARGLLKCRLEPRLGAVARLEAVEQAVAALRENAVRDGIQVLMHSEYPMTGEMRGRQCLAAPLHAAYFSYDGKVSPCCHFGHHVSRFFAGRFFPPSSFVLGDIVRQDLEEIWESPSYREFRDGFTSGAFPAACRTCYLLYGK